jgi:hypothetical protein
MSTKIMGENFGNVGFRVLDKNKQSIAEDLDANDVEGLKRLAVESQSDLLILQISCGNPERCSKGWHDAMLFFEGALWVSIESVQGPSIMPTMIAFGQYN